MKTNMQITRALISLGVILNCIYAQNLSEPTAQTSVAVTTASVTSGTPTDAPIVTNNPTATDAQSTNVQSTTSMLTRVSTLFPLPKIETPTVVTDTPPTDNTLMETLRPKSSSEATSTIDNHDKGQTTIQETPRVATTSKPSIVMPNPASSLTTTPQPDVLVTSQALNVPAETTISASTGFKAPSGEIVSTSQTSGPDQHTMVGTPTPELIFLSVTTVSVPEHTVHETTTTPTTTTFSTKTPTALTTQVTVLPTENNKLKRFSLSKGKQNDEDNKNLTAVCQKLMLDMKNGTCTIFWHVDNGATKLTTVEVIGEVDISTAHRYLAEATEKPSDKTTLIAILTSCCALFAMIVGLAIYASHHRKPYSETQQHLTEELHTVENGYHDNPTLEVMEVQPEMQEKKVALNGEFNDSWIVPIDNLLKEDLPDEEDTHL